MLTPGEIVIPKAESADVLEGRSVIASGKSSAPGKKIIGGKLSVTPTKAAHGSVIGGRDPNAPNDPNPTRAMPIRIVGGKKGSAELFPRMGAFAMGATAAAAMQPPSSDAKLERVIQQLAAINVATQAAAQVEPASVDNSVTIEGNIYGGDAGMRELSRQLARFRRLDSNRDIR